LEHVPKKLIDFSDSDMLPLFGFERFLPVTESRVIWKRSQFFAGGQAPERNPQPLQLDGPLNKPFENGSNAA
jgi:hypothetical protein